MTFVYAPWRNLHGFESCAGEDYAWHRIRMRRLSLPSWSEPWPRGNHRLLHTTFQVEVAGHLGYVRGDPVALGRGNSRNEPTAKKVHTDIARSVSKCPGNGRVRSRRR
jgi:hypothetical protein